MFSAAMIMHKKKQFGSIVNAAFVWGNKTGQRKLEVVNNKREKALQ